MALYLNEVWIKDPNPERVKEFFDLMNSAIQSPASLSDSLQGARIAAGPWASNEEAKVLFIFDVPDHTPTFQIFGKLVSTGLVEKRRLTPIVEWADVEKMVGQL